MLPLCKKPDGEADSRAEPPATSARGTAGKLACLAVWSAATEIEAAHAGQGSKRGTINPGVVVRRSSFETTALEMPAGFGRMHHHAILHAMGGRARTYGQAM
ncbi:MAG TPA: hypothetical protein VGK21_02415 [Candidatus Angelobacter sp.]